MRLIVLSLLGIALSAITLPLILELALVTLAGLLPKRARLDRRSLKRDAMNLAVLIPAHNEEMLIARCVQSLRDSANGDARIFVIAHNCTDSTAEQAGKAGAEVLVYNDAAAAGKGYALQYGFKHALAQQADAVLVVDADSWVSSNLVPRVIAAMKNGADAIQCRYEMGSPNDASNGRLAALAFRAFNVIRPRGRERLGLSAGIFGNGFAIASEVLRQIPYGAFSVVEDLEYHIHLVLAGKRVRYIERAVVLAELPASKQGETVQRSRWEGGRMQAARVWFWPLVKQVLRGRIRAAEPLLDLASLPMAYAVFSLLIALCLPLGWLRIYSVIALTIVLLHVLSAALAGPDRWGTLRLLVMAPFYVIWKLRLIPGVLRGSSKRAAWVRTQRDAT